MLSYNNKLNKTYLEAATFFEKNKNISISKCAEMFKIDRQCFSKKLKELDLFEDRRGYNIDSSFFNVIDTEEKAYWLGFLTADGCIKSNNSLSLGLSYKDIKHLNKLKKSLKTDHPIYINTTKAFNKEYKTCYLTISNQQIVNDLKKLGFITNKTLNERPIDIDISVANHYIRGLYDGDGWISFGKNYCELGIAMGYKIINFIREQLMKYTNIKEYKIIPYQNIFRYKITSKYEIEKVVNFLYSNANIYLDRKHKKILNFAVLKQITLKF